MAFLSKAGLVGSARKSLGKAGSPFGELTHLFIGDV